jgi:hypothetical protein
MTQGQRAFGYTAAAFVAALAPLSLARSAQLLPVLAVPALLVGLAWITLHQRCSRGGRSTAPVAWSLVTLLGAWCIVGGFLGGFFAVPAFFLLVAGAGATPAAT